MAVPILRQGWRRLAVAAFFLLFSGCGGGSGSSTSISIDRQAMSFTAAPGGPATPKQIVNVKFHGDGVIVGYPPGTSDPGWLSVTELGHTQDSAQFSLQAGATNYMGSISFDTVLRFATGHADGGTVKYVDLPIHYDIGGALLQAPRQIDIAITGASTITDLNTPVELEVVNATESVSWHIDYVSVPWLKISPMSGTTSTQSTLIVSIDPSAAQGLVNNDYQSAFVNIGYSNSHSSDLLAPLIVSLHLALPTVTAVSPAVAYTTSPYELIVRGTNLSVLTANKVSVGNVSAGSLRSINETTAAATFTSLPPGPQQVRVNNVLNLDLGSAMLNVLTPAQYPSAGPNAAVPGRLFFEPTRSLMFSEDSGAPIKPFRYSNGAWQALSPVGIQPLRARIAPHEDALLVLEADGRLLSFNLDNLTAAPTTLFDLAQHQYGCSLTVFDLGVTDSNQAVITAPYHSCSPDGGNLFITDIGSPGAYPMSTALFTGSNNYILQPASGRSVIYGASGGTVCPGVGVVYPSGAGSWGGPQGSVVVIREPQFLPISSSGDRVVMIEPDRDENQYCTGYSNLAVFDEGLFRRGGLSMKAGTPLAMSPNGKTLYWPDPANNLLHLIDISDSLQPGGAYIETATVPMSADPTSVSDLKVTTIALTPDGGQLFVGGFVSGGASKLVTITLQ